MNRGSATIVLVALLVTVAGAASGRWVLTLTALACAVCELMTAD